MKKPKVFYRKPLPVGFVLQIAAVTGILILVVTAMLWNAAGLWTVLEHSTDAYVKDVSNQLTSDITARLETDQAVLEQIADSVSRLPASENRADFLKRKAELLDFDSFVLVNPDGTCVPPEADIPGLKDMAERYAEAGTERSVIHVEGQNLFFFTPVCEQNRTIQLLTGIRNTENMQELICPKSFDGKGLTCIIDSQGQVVISPTELKPFMQLDDIFKNGNDQRATAAIEKMQENMAHGTPGVFHFTAVDETRLVLSYHAIGVSDWVLLTLVPADLISGYADQYIFRSFSIVGGVILVFMLFLALIVLFYRKNRIEMEKTAFFDPLTGGMNQAAFQAGYNRLAERMLPNTYALVMLNVKNFKFVNENFGIDAGNETLKYIYQVLQRHISEHELAARGEADRFFLCLRETSQEKIRARLAHMLADIYTGTRLGDSKYRLKIAQGACVIDEPGMNITRLQDRARTACQRAGSDERCVFYTTDLAEKIRREQMLSALFEGSIENHDFQVFLQPKVQLCDQTVGGAEALVRWIHPEHGVIFPSDFIPLFEKNGNIVRLDLYVFEAVCAMLKQWKDTGKPLFPISVNLSRIHFRIQDFLQSFLEIKEKYQIPDGILELELTESIFFDQGQIELVKNSILEMHRHGILCSLDDFGVGFSSLALLKEFEVDTIKLDRQFFKDISNQKAQKVIASFIELADKLDIRVVAEGIETQEQLTCLYRLHCDMVQGYIFSKPLPIPAFEAWLKDMENETEKESPLTRNNACV